MYIINTAEGTEDDEGMVSCISLGEAAELVPGYGSMSAFCCI